jgi:hypothetical protein
MKFDKVILAVLLAIAMVSVTAGCKKQETVKGPSGAPLVIEGVSVDMPKLQRVIDASGNADLQGAVRNVFISFRYHEYEKALMGMDKLANDPALNEEQKKVAAEVLEQVKQVATKVPAPAEPAAAQ